MRAYGILRSHIPRTRRARHICSAGLELEPAQKRGQRQDAGERDVPAMARLIQTEPIGTVRHEHLCRLR
jgi:hypothetical protein